MKRAAFFLVLLFSIVYLVSPLMVYAAQSTKGVIDDSTITTKVKANLAKDARVGTLTGIEVNTTKGVVTLSGKVNDKTEKKLVGDIARKTKGVKKVHNNVQVVP